MVNDYAHYILQLSLQLQLQLSITIVNMILIMIMKMNYVVDAYDCVIVFIVVIVFAVLQDF
jgi:hypothetical protein